VRFAFEVILATPDTWFAVVAVLGFCAFNLDHLPQHG
jgi:hypothetical protein